MKVKIHNPVLWDKYLKSATLLISVLSLILLFVNSPEYRLYTLIIFVIILISLFLIMWVVANGKKHLKMNIMGSDVEICQGDIFKCDDEQKVIAFNEFFDTDVDDYLVMKRSVNGRYISKYFDNNIDILDKIIENYPNSSTRITEQNVVRISGKRNRYKLGTIIPNGDYLLLAFAKYDDDIGSYLEMDDYLSCLINFWKQCNRYSLGKTLVLPLLGSGITRFPGCAQISDQELLEMILWTFKVSSIKINPPHKLKIVLTKNRLKRINLYEVGAHFHKMSLR